MRAAVCCQPSLGARGVFPLGFGNSTLGADWELTGEAPDVSDSGSLYGSKLEKEMEHRSASISIVRISSVAGHSVPERLVPDRTGGVVQNTPDQFKSRL